LHKALDLLVIDEASQVALPDLLAAAQCANNVVVLGDPQQLQGITVAHHHGGVEQSCINWLIGESRPTVEADRGVFLDTTYRLGPDIARFCSETMYDGKLRNAAATAKATLHLPPRMKRGITGSGLRLVTVDHTGNRTASAAEADAVAQVVKQLVGQTWRDGINRQRRLLASDILVTTPFNAHRIQLEQQLRHRYPGIRIGTVDKMQGQEAPVVIYSTAISDPTEAPKGPEFVLDNNRLNVAISRAQGLAVLVTSRALLDHKPRTVEHFYLQNALARFEELATPVVLQRSLDQPVTLRPRATTAAPAPAVPFNQMPMQFTHHYTVSLPEELGPEL
jgi:uncharacterized protein